MCDKRETKPVCWEAKKMVTGEKNGIVIGWGCGG